MRPYDWVTFASAGALVVAVLAAWIPAHRPARIEPEPATLGLVTTGLIGAMAARRRQRKARWRG